MIHSSKFHSFNTNQHKKILTGVLLRVSAFPTRFAVITARKPAGAPQACAQSTRPTPPQIGAVTMIPQGDGVDVPEVKSKRPTGTFIYMPLHSYDLFRCARVYLSICSCVGGKCDVRTFWLKIISMPTPTYAYCYRSVVILHTHLYLKPQACDSDSTRHKTTVTLHMRPLHDDDDLLICRHIDILFVYISIQS